MFLKIENFLTPAEVQSITEIARQAKFIDGRLSNPHNVAKDNVISDASDPQARQAIQIAFTALQRSEQLRDFAFPRRIAPPTLLRYDVGRKYGPHVDAPYMRVGSEPLRSDLSATVFLSPPQSYQGGELAIHLGTEVVIVKGEPGTAVFYPSTTLHEVVPVTAGSRLVLITFIESQIPDERQRDLLYTLGEVRALEGLKMEWHNRTQLEYVITNLLRMWSR
ncbi:MAG: Fe2+-dependent dioxygenase [Proteobacteria bacterium]|nr:Fe2+-dependent dioxygenase [Pseudomonadota bacterium]